MGNIIDGRAIASAHRKELQEKIKERLKSGGRVPCLVTFMVGQDEGSAYYVKNKNKLCEEIGVKAIDENFGVDITEEELIKQIEKYNRDTAVDGIIFQLPLPKGFDEKKITSKISPEKDVDGLTDINMGKLIKGVQCFIPCTPKGILELLKYVSGTLSGKHAVIIGRSNIVGKPVAHLLLKEDATVTICHSRTESLKDISSQADIVIAALGKPGFITAEYIKHGAIVIDVGTTPVNGVLRGDVDFEAATEKCAYITPVPGGVGAMTTTMLLKNTYEAMIQNVR